MHNQRRGQQILASAIVQITINDILYKCNYPSKTIRIANQSLNDLSSQPDGAGAEPLATLRITSPDKTTPSTWMRGAESGKIGQGAPEEGGCSLRKDSTVEGTNGARPRWKRQRVAREIKPLSSKVLARAMRLSEEGPRWEVTGTA